MVNVASAVNRGYAFSTDQQRRAAAEERAQAEEAQRQIDRQRRNAGMDALTERYGEVAGVPTEYGQLTGIEQRGQRFENDMEDRDRSLQIEAAQRAAAVVDQMAAQGAPPERIAARLQNMPDEVFGGPERAAEARALALEDPAQASALLAGLAGQGAPQPEYGAADFYEVDGQEVFGRPVQQPDGTMAFEELPFQAVQDRAVQFQDPDFPGILFERDTRTGQVRTVARNPASSRSGSGDGDGAGMELADLPEDERRARLRLLAANRMDEFADVQNTVNTALEMVGPLSAGAAQTATGWLGGTPAGNLNRILEPLRSGIARDQIAQMKREAEDSGSRGTGLGQITQRELEMLQNAMAAIDPALGAELLEEQLTNVLALRERVARRMYYIDAIDSGLMTYGQAIEALQAEGIRVPDAPGPAAGGAGGSGLSPEIEAILAQYEGDEG